MMRYPFLLVIMFGFWPLEAQELPPSIQFWEELSSHCGKAYEGELITGGTDDFKGKKLIMHVRSCEEGIIKIPFVVGENRSRTWILTLKDDLIQLKHDHRHEDGSEEDITQYGGTSPNSGLAHLQFFPADRETSQLISYASTNVWWFTLEENFLTYNLRRIGTDRLFTVRFDLSREVPAPLAPWGQE